MRKYALLLKKQLLDALPFGSKQSRSKNAFSYILASVLIAGVIAVFALIFSKFTSTYLQIKINRVPDIAARQFEFMSVSYFILLVALTLTGVGQLCYTLFDNSDIGILISMPFSAGEMFSSKLTWIYIKQAVLSLVCVLTINITFFTTAGLISAYNVLMSFVVALFMPVLPLAAASILVLPYYYIKRIVNSHYLLSFAVMTLILVGFCLIYAYAFGIVERLVDSGRLVSMFNEKTMASIGAFASSCFPANMIAGVMLARDVGKNIGILVAVIIAAAAICIVVVRAVFFRVSQKGFGFHIPHIRHEGFRFYSRGRWGNLLFKEFITVMRTPSYAFMYFATAIAMPLMAYYSAKLATSLLTGLFGNVRFGFELCTFIVILYASLTNTFCSTSISRDGYMCMTQKTLPYSPSQILSVKMIFSGAVSELSILIACITLAASGLESAGDAVVTFISATLLAVAQMAFATRLDLNHPHFARSDDGEIKEANSTVSVIILVGMVVCFALGMLLLYNALGSLIGGSGAATAGKAAGYAYAICIPLALLGASAAYFFVNLKKVYANLDAEG